MEIDIGFRYTSEEELYSLAKALILVKKSQDIMKGLAVAESELLEKQAEKAKLINEIAKLQEEKKKIEVEISELRKKLSTLSTALQSLEQ